MPGHTPGARVCGRLGVVGLGWRAIHAMSRRKKEDPREQKDAGLYFTVQSIESVIKIVQEKAEIIEINNQTEYGMREVVFKDLNGFQVTFGCKPDM